MPTRIYFCRLVEDGTRRRPEMAVLMDEHLPAGTATRFSAAVDPARSLAMVLLGAPAGVHDALALQPAIKQLPITAENIDTRLDAIPASTRQNIDDWLTARGFVTTTASVLLADPDATVRTFVREVFREIEGYAAPFEQADVNVD